jgi:hypothetical protein
VRHALADAVTDGFAFAQAITDGVALTGACDMRDGFAVSVAKRFGVPVAVAEPVTVGEPVTVAFAEPNRLGPVPHAFGLRRARRETDRRALSHFSTCDDRLLSQPRPSWSESRRYGSEPVTL